MIIGITGTTGAGKGTVVEILKRFEFAHFSVRGLLETELRKQNKELSRINMITLADGWRKDNCPGYIIENLVTLAQEKGGNTVVESIRTLGEVDAFRKNAPEGILLAIDADQKTRYERNFKRGASTDNVSFERFQAEEQKESEGTDPWRGNLPACIKKADVVIRNDGDMIEFEQQIIYFLHRYGVN